MTHRCRECRYTTAKWMGFCPQCRTHGALESAVATAAVAPVPIAEAAAGNGRPRRVAGIPEIDRVLGGGLVEGSVVLVGGEPGVGKSTLLLQLAAAMAAGGEVLYVSGEESVHQVGVRSGRIGAAADGLLVLAETEVEAVHDAIRSAGPSLVVIDSIQTMRAGSAEGVPGGVTQVRACGARLAETARRTGVPVVLVGHVTKDGVLAGPKVLEHLVDVVLYLEGDAERGLRYLRGLKNRFGTVDQVGVFEMTEAGMVEVADPTGLFVNASSGSVPGSVIFPAMYGRRSLLVEVQALVAPSPTPQPRRSVKGVEAARVHQLLAVLDRHAAISCADRDVYVNVVGGLTLRDPAADLAVALAVASSRLERPLGTVAAFGEVGLAGEIRAVSHDARRTAEATRFGIDRLVTAAEADRVVAALMVAGIDETRRTSAPVGR